MQTIHFPRLLEIKRNKTELEKKLNVKIIIQGHKITIKGDILDEFEASKVLDAINFGFSAKQAISLKDDSMALKIINIKDFTKKKNLQIVRARLIGRKGRTKRTIENLTDCKIVIKDNEVGIIGDIESVEEIITAMGGLIRGTKQSNTYRYLEKMNKRKRSEQ